METGRLIGSVVIIVVAAVILYYLYDYMFNIGSIQKKGEIIPGVVSSKAEPKAYPDGSDDKTPKLNQMIFTGGEMSISFWIYVTGTQNNSANKKHILHLGATADGSDSNNVLAVMLGPTTTNALYIKIAEGEGFNVQNFAVQNTMTSDTTSNCNVSNIEFGRWVNVVIVLNNNLCDVYMDGKLSRSCVLKNQFLVPTGTNIYFHALKKSLGADTLTGWDGSISSLNFYNYAISPDEAYRIYFAGPSGSSGNLWDAIKSFFGAGQKAAAVFTSS